MHLKKDFKDRNLENYYDLIGSSPIPGTSLSVQNYIQKFNTIRKSLIEFDKELFEFIFE